MLLHHRLMLASKYGGRRPSQLIMSTRSYAMREKRDMSPTGSREPRGSAIDQTWNPSRGITFRTPPRDRSWRPSWGLVFSNENADSAKNSSSSVTPASATRSLPSLPPVQHQHSVHHMLANTSPSVDDSLLHTKERGEASGSAASKEEMQQEVCELDDGCGRISYLVEKSKRVELRSYNPSTATSRRFERFIGRQLRYCRWEHNLRLRILHRRGERPINLRHKVIERLSKTNLHKFRILKNKRNAYVSGVLSQRFAAPVQIFIGNVKEYRFRSGLHRYRMNDEMGRDKILFVRNTGKSALSFSVILRIGSKKPDITTQESLSTRKNVPKHQKVFVPESDEVKSQEGRRNQINSVDQFNSSQALTTTSIGHLSLSRTKPLYSPLGFHIPNTDLHNIRNASPDQKRIYWQYTLYQGPSGEKVIVDYCKDKEATELVAQKFLDQQVIGFDIEWKAQASLKQGVRKNVALIQLASEERIALFHIALYPEGDTLENLVAPSLQKIMESSSITKAGVSIKADCTRLRRFMGIDSHGLFELSYLYKLVKYSTDDTKKINKLLVSLAQQVEEHFELPLWKGEVRDSDWTKELTDEQIQYAASDSYAAFHLYHFLDDKRKSLSPIPPIPFHAELNIPIQLGNNETIATDDELEACDDVSSTSLADAPEPMSEIVRDLNIVREDSSATKPVVEKAKSKPLQRSTPAARGPEFEVAKEWVESWLASRSATDGSRIMATQLRAYAIWHEQRKSVWSTAQIMRDPPLKKATVATYLLEVLESKELPFKKERIAELLLCLPPKTRRMYYKFLLKKGWWWY